MSRGRAIGTRVTHRLSRLTSGMARCTCGRPFYADTAEEAETVFRAHLDRMEKAGHPVDRTAPPTHGRRR